MNINSDDVANMLRFLLYSWEPIDFRYDQLTNSEREICTEREFDRLVALVHDVLICGLQPPVDARMDEAKMRQEEHTRVAQMIELFPKEFGLMRFFGETFRISPESSYVDDEGRVILYTQRRQADGTWLDFAKGSANELMAQISESDRAKI